MANDQQKFKVLSLLLNGVTPKQVEQNPEVNVGYATILRWNREFQAAQEQGELDKIMDVDKALLGELIEGIEARTPEALRDAIHDSAQGIKEARTVAEKLQTDLYATAAAINQRIKSMSLSIENIGELNMLTESLCDLQNAFFNKNSTQVNVQNNYDSNNRAYSTFLNDKPAGIQHEQV